jgi:integrase
MAKIDTLIKAATRENTRKSYRSAVEHFEDNWGGFLPATAESVARYLADHAETLSSATLRNRLSGIAQWHIDQGFPDPTKNPLVKKVMRGINQLYPYTPKQAQPIQVHQLQKVIDAIDEQLLLATTQNNPKPLLQLTRDKALLLIAFWRGFRSDELSSIKIEHVTVYPNEGMDLFIPSSKTDRFNTGRHLKLPALTNLCPVDAFLDWLSVSQLKSGAVFRKIDRWGNVSDQPIKSASVSKIIRRVFEQTGQQNANEFSSHSFRRGFATWANQNNWDLKALMEYVGWKDMKSALKYIDNNDQYAKLKIQEGITQITNGS